MDRGLAGPNDWFVQFLGFGLGCAARGGFSPSGPASGGYAALMVDVSRPLRERLIAFEDVDSDLARGNAQRTSAPRRSLAELVPSNRSATEILVEQNRDRLPDLVPLRFARMLADPFSFYRGSAAVMAADLAASPSSGVEVMCGGDAHLSNFGIYAAPQRSLIFDLNDFDEAAVAPAEWDLKRLITSAIVGGRHAGYPEKTIRGFATDAVRQYRDGLDAMLEMNVLDRYYLRLEPRALHQAGLCRPGSRHRQDRAQPRAAKPQRGCSPASWRPDPMAGCGFGKPPRSWNMSPSQTKRPSPRRSASTSPACPPTWQCCCPTSS